MAAETISKHLPRFFASFAVLMLVVCAMAGMVLTSDDSDAVNRGSSSSPLSSVSPSYETATYYAYVGASVSMTGSAVYEPSEGYDVTYVVSVTSGYGLTRSSYTDPSETSSTWGNEDVGKVSGTISKAGTIKIQWKNVIEIDGMDGPETTTGTVTIIAVAQSTPVTSVSISGSSSVNKGSTITLTATTSPTSATDRHVTWSITSGSSYASIQSTSDTTTGGKCVIKGVSAGSVTVKATAADGSGKSATKTITVNNPSYSYYLYYDDNGGSGGPGSASKTSTSTSSTLSFTISSIEPTRSGYTFLGWSKSSTATSATYTAGDTVSVTYDDLTLYAVWEAEKRYYYAYLYYNANGGSGAPSTQSASIYASSATGSKSFTISSTQPSRSGYTFLGWSTSSGASSASYQPGGTISVSYDASKTLYAVWKVVSYTSTLSYNANGGTGAPSAQTYTGSSTSSHTFTISSTEPTRSGYEFLGWSTSSTATSASYQPGSTISVSYNGSKTLYAVWQEVPVEVDRGTIASGDTVRILVDEVSKLTISIAASAGAYMQAVSGESWVVYDTARGTGIVTATPTETGVYDFTVRLVVPGLDETTLSYTLVVVESMDDDVYLEITSDPATRSLKVNQSWSYKPTVNISGYTVSVSGASWLSVSNGTISGTPTTAGTYNVTVTVSKSGGYVSDTQTFVLKVYSALGFNSVPGANGMFAFAE